MQFGFFDDQRREYVIASPRTPLPWINYLGSEDFFTLLSNTAGGYCFYRDARLRRLTRYRYNNSPLDQEGFHIYIKDGDTVWNPGWQPAKTELDPLYLPSRSRLQRDRGAEGWRLSGYADAGGCRATTACLSG